MNTTPAEKRVEELAKYLEGVSNAGIKLLYTSEEFAVPETVDVHHTGAFTDGFEMVTCEVLAYNVAKKSILVMLNENLYCSATFSDGRWSGTSWPLFRVLAGIDNLFI